ncbi:MAG: DHH family phosphoesterase [Magnetococcus sp. DMHC-6]
MKQEIIDEKTRELEALLIAHKGERHLIAMQDFPDPDSISCAFAYQLIAQKYAIDTEIFYCGRVSHQENIALIHLLDINLVRWQEEYLSGERFQGAVFVDTQGTTSHLSQLVAAAGIPVFAIIDHHEMQEMAQEPLFLDMRSCEACASIFVHYIASGILTLQPSNPIHHKLATALMHGIVSDTGSMTRATQFDFIQAAFLQPLCDVDLLIEIRHQQRSHKVMEVIRKALASREAREGLSLSGVGFIRAEERDAIPQAADFLLTEENVHTVVVYGVVTDAQKGDVIHGSLRTVKLTFGPDAFLKEALGRDANGEYYGGGKAMSGGFEIPLDFLSGADDPELMRLKWEAYNSKIRQKFFTRIGVEH